MEINHNLILPVSESTPPLLQLQSAWGCFPLSTNYRNSSNNVQILLKITLYKVLSIIYYSSSGMQELLYKNYEVWKIPIIY